MALGTVTLEPMTEGDTWAGITQIGPLVFRHYDDTDPAAGVDGYVIDAPPGVLVSAKLHFVRDGLRKPELKCDTAYTVSGSAMHPMVIVTGDVSGEDWTLAIGPMAFNLFPLTEGTWTGEFEAVYGSNPGTKLTLFNVIQVIEPQTTV